MLTAKMDIKEAYRNIHVTPEDRHLLGFTWNASIFIDKMLPFSLRSAPLIFTAVAGTLTWIMNKQGVMWAVHYIDHFLKIGKPESGNCLRNMKLMEETVAFAGLPIEPEK